MNEGPINKFSLKVESTIGDLFLFIWRFVVTAYSTVFKPGKIIQDLTNENETSQFVRPFTFLVIAAVIGGFSFGSYNFWEMYSGKESLLKFYETIISESSLYNHLLQIFPIIFIVVLFAILASFIIEKKTKGLKSFTVKILCFCGGCQILLMNFITIFIYYTAVKARLNQVQQIGVSQVEYIEGIETLLGSPAYVLFIILFVSCATYILGTGAIYKLFNDKVKTSNRLIKLSIFICSIMISIALATSIQFAYKIPRFFKWVKKIENNEYTYEDGRKLINYIGAHVSSAQYLIVNKDIILTVFPINNLTDTLALIPNALEAKIVILDKDGKIYKAYYIPPKKVEFTDWEGRGEIIRIQPNNVSWIKLKLDVDTKLEELINSSIMQNTSEHKFFQFKFELIIESLIQAPAIHLVTEGNVFVVNEGNKIIQ